MILIDKTMMLLTFLSLKIPIYEFESYITKIVNFKCIQNRYVYFILLNSKSQTTISDYTN